MHWTLLNPSVLPADKRPNGIYFRPKVIYNAATRKFVLWFNYVTAGWSCPADFEHCWSVYGTAISDTPAGPFVISKLPVLMGTGNASYAHGDFTLFGDDNGKAYIVYNAYEQMFDHDRPGHHSNSVDELSVDYTTSSVVQWSGFFAGGEGGDEAQVMFKRKGVYYAIIAQACFL